MKPQPPVRPFLRWAGSKRKLLPILAGHWTDGPRTYLEPFAGSACLFFYILPKRAILGDINPDLIGTFRQLKRDWEAVNGALRSLPLGEVAYYEVRSRGLAAYPPHIRAARFIYLNRFSFNGIYRTNQNGVFNVPYGGSKTGGLPSPDQLRQCSRASKVARLISGDFSKVLSHAKPGDFVYLDPPHATTARRIFTEYGPRPFGQEDIDRLGAWLDRLTAQKVEFLLSYADSPEGRQLAKGYASRTVTVRRNIAGFAANRRLSTEILVNNRPMLAR